MGRRFLIGAFWIAQMAKSIVFFTVNAMILWQDFTYFVPNRDHEINQNVFFWNGLCSIKDFHIGVSCEIILIYLSPANQNRHSNSNFCLDATNLWLWCNKSLTIKYLGLFYCYLSDWISWVRMSSTLSHISSYRGSPPYAFFGTWNKPCYMKLVLVGLYCGPLLTLIPPLTRT